MVQFGIVVMLNMLLGGKWVFFFFSWQFKLIWVVPNPSKCFCYLSDKFHSQFHRVMSQVGTE